MTGKPDYYENRHADFVNRYVVGPTFDCQLTPPDYYLGYGGKYCHRFTEELRPKLSAAGQKWVDQTARNLQSSIEDQRDDAPSDFDALERQNERFRKFAFDTHPDAYLDGGLQYVNLYDLALIGTTPEVGDLITVAGLTQAFEVSLRLAPRWSVDLKLITLEDLAAADAAIKEDRSAIREGVQDARDWLAPKVEPIIWLVDQYLGPGATVDLADGLRQAIHDEIYAYARRSRGTRALPPPNP